MTLRASTTQPFLVAVRKINASLSALRCSALPYRCSRAFRLVPAFAYPLTSPMPLRGASLSLFGGSVSELAILANCDKSAPYKRTLEISSLGND